ncbi:MAG: type II secretion system protein GspN [Desulfovibrio sp.]|nr:type II secretion system protein GspN [Desulfovibrio sp.]
MLSLAGIKRGWLWGSLFAFFFFIFFGRLWIIDAVAARVGTLSRLAAQRNIAINDFKFIFFPPEAKIRSVVVPVGGASLAIEDIVLRLAFFPPAIGASANVMGGKLSARAKLGLGFPPLPSRAKFSLDKADAAVLNSFPALANFIDQAKGEINLTGQMELTGEKSRIDWNKAGGEFVGSLRDGSVSLKIPLLQNNNLADIRGDAVLKMENSTLALERCRFASGLLSFEASGTLRPWTRPETARLELGTELRIPADAVNPALIPPRTMEQIDKRGSVRATVSGTLADPKIYLEN